MIDTDALLFAIAYAWEVYKSVLGVVSLILFGAFVLAIMHDAWMHRKAMREQRTRDVVRLQCTEILEACHFGEEAELP